MANKIWHTSSLRGFEDSPSRLKNLFDRSLYRCCEAAPGHRFGWRTESLRASSRGGCRALPEARRTAFADRARRNGNRAKRRGDTASKQLLVTVWGRLAMAMHLRNL